MTHRA